MNWLEAAANWCTAFWFAVAALTLAWRAGRAAWKKLTGGKE